MIDYSQIFEVYVSCYQSWHKWNKHLFSFDNFFLNYHGAWPSRRKIQHASHITFRNGPESKMIFQIKQNIFKVKNQPDKLLSYLSESQENLCQSCWFWYHKNGANKKNVFNWNKKFRHTNIAVKNIGPLLTGIQILS